MKSTSSTFVVLIELQSKNIKDPQPLNVGTCLIYPTKCHW